MPGRLLSTLAKVAPSSPTPKLETHLFPPVYSTQAPAKAKAKSEDSLVMDIFNRHKHDHQKKNPKAETPGVAFMNMSVESPPIVFYNSPETSSGALLSGQLVINVCEQSITIEAFEMRLLALVSTKKPVGAHCPDCSSQEMEIHKWDFLTHQASLCHGQHSFPYSYLLSGHLPATTHGSIASLDYYLSAVATTSSGDKITYKRCLDVRRAIFPGSEKHSLRIFPPTNLTASLTLPPVIHPIGDFPVQMRLSGISHNDSISQTRWRLRKLSWRIEETQKYTAPACSKHGSKVGGEGKSICHEDMRNIANEEVKTGWKSNFEKGEIDIEFKIACDFGLKPLCDIESGNSMSVKHSFIIEMVVAEEWAPLKKLSQGTPTGAARVLRAQFHIVLTERSGMGIAWDEEQPPIYEDVPASPPTYVHDCTLSDSSCSSRSTSFSL